MALVSSQDVFVAPRRAGLHAAVTIQEYRTIAGRFCDAIEKRCLRIGGIDGAIPDRLRHAVLIGVNGNVPSYAKFCAGRFIEHLIEAR
jgi:hypothetical protein